MLASLGWPSWQDLRSRLSDVFPVVVYPTLRTLIINALRLGPMPRHISFIMDGNRRYSRFHGIPLREGHLRGFEALKGTLELLLRLGVQHVTVYAFAIQNNKRGPAEVHELMEMSKDKMSELFDQSGIRIHFVGRVDLLPRDVQDLVRQVEELTSHNTRGTINVAFSYAALEEITSSVKKSVGHALENGLPASSSIDIDTLASNLYTTHTPPLDMLVRSSGVNRISDFFLWQLIINSSKYTRNPHDKSPGSNRNRDTIPGAKYHIVPTYWPDFGMWDMIPIIVEWQAEEFLRRMAKVPRLESPPIIC